MGSVVPSYVLKMQRAEQHLAEAQRMIADYIDSHPYEVAKSVEDDQGGSVRTLRFTKQPGDELAVVIGDFIHNIRSGLNHLAVACTPRENWRKVQFPIFARDPFERDPTTGQYLQGSKDRSDARGAWSRHTAGMSPEAVAAIKWLQPFNSGLYDLNLHGLLLLEDFSNADKHRELVIIASALRDPTITVTGLDGIPRPLTIPGNANNGAQIGTISFPCEVNVEITGTPLVIAAVGEPLAYVELPGALVTILTACRDGVIPRLRPYVIH